MTEGKHIKSWLNRVLRIVGRDGVGEGDLEDRWCPANGSGQQLELNMEVPVNQVKKAMSARRRSSTAHVAVRRLSSGEP